MDTNILISGLFYEDKHAQKLLSKIKHGSVKLFVSEEILYEYIGIVCMYALEAGLDWQEAQKPLTKIANILVQAKAVKPQIKLRITEDSSDNKFFNCAYEADIELIISNDKHLHVTEPVKTCKNHLIRILTPWQYFNQNRHFNP